MARSLGVQLNEEILLASLATGSLISPNLLITERQRAGFHLLVYIVPALCLYPFEHRDLRALTNDPAAPGEQTVNVYPEPI